MERLTHGERGKLSLLRQADGVRTRLLKYHDNRRNDKHAQAGAGHAEA
jgi:hypothetical protein